LDKEINKKRKVNRNREIEKEKTKKNNRNNWRKKEVRKV
jgi:hypothetical protein